MENEQLINQLREKRPDLFSGDSVSSELVVQARLRGELSDDEYGALIGLYASAWAHALGA